MPSARSLNSQVAELQKCVSSRVAGVKFTTARRRRHSETSERLFLNFQALSQFENQRKPSLVCPSWSLRVRGPEVIK